MSALALEQVDAGGFRGASFAVGPGELVVLETASAADADVLLRLLAGSAQPEAGAIALFGEPLAGIGEERRLVLLARTGVAWADGGCLSNLKAWENILLPLWYHGDRQAARREPEVLALLERLGVERERMPGLLQSLPGRLELRERRAVGAAGALLREPELMIWAETFDGMDTHARTHFIAAARWFHGERPGRATLVLTSDPGAVGELGAAARLRQGRDGRVEPWR